MGTNFEKEWDAYDKCKDKEGYLASLVGRKMSLKKNIEKMREEVAVIQAVIDHIEMDLRRSISM